MRSGLIGAVAAGEPNAGVSCAPAGVTASISVARVADSAVPRVLILQLPLDVSLSVFTRAPPPALRQCRRTPAKTFGPR